MDHLLGFLLGYAIGSVPFGLLLALAAGKGDIRKMGSGNIGATNVLRTGSKWLAATTLLLDLAKGFAPVWLAWRWFPDAVPLAALGAVVGHCFPVWLGFRGGKGVATFIGVVFGIDWVLGVGTGLTWIIIAFFFRYSSLAALVAAIFAPFYWVLLFGAQARVLVIVAMSALLVWRHRKNIANLLAGKESRIGMKSGDKPGEAAKARKGGHRRIV